MSKGKDFWAENKRKALRDDQRKLVKKSSQSIESFCDGSYCHAFFGISHLVLHLVEFSDIETIRSICFVNKTLQAHIATQTRLARKKLNEIFNATMRINDLGDAPSLNELKDIYNQGKNICVHGFEHPFVIDVVNDQENCIKTKDVLPDVPISFKSSLQEGRADHWLHFRMASNSMKAFHDSFKGNPISDAMKRLISFSNSTISNCFTNSCEIKQFIQQKERFFGTKTSDIDEIEAEIWQPIKLTSRLDCVNVEMDPSIRPLQIRELDYFLHYFDTKYAVSRFIEYLDWNYFEIMGGAPHNALVAISEDTVPVPSTDLDIFAHSMHYGEFLKALTEFEQGLIKEGIKTIKSITDKKTVTYFLVFSPAFQVKVQIIYTCASATKATILASFDISAVQLGFNPATLILTWTPAFEDFVQTSTAAIFDMTQDPTFIHSVTMRRIIKYQRRGIKKWKIPYGFNLRLFEEQLNAASRRFDLSNYGWSSGVPIQIGFQPAHYLLWRTYPKGCFSERSCIRSNNHDETGILRMFLTLLLNRED